MLCRLLKVKWLKGNICFYFLTMCPNCLPKTLHPFPLAARMCESYMQQPCILFLEAGAVWKQTARKCKYCYQSFPHLLFFFKYLMLKFNRMWSYSWLIGSSFTLVAMTEILGLNSWEWHRIFQCHKPLHLCHIGSLTPTSKHVIVVFS